MKPFIPDENFKIFYMTLTSELIGYCIKIKTHNIDLAKKFANIVYEKRHCDVYDYLPNKCRVIGEEVIIYDDSDIL